jgi:hypothetical protein
MFWQILAYAWGAGLFKLRLSAGRADLVTINFKKFKKSSRDSVLNSLALALKLIQCVASTTDCTLV